MKKQTRKKSRKKSEPATQKDIETRPVSADTPTESPVPLNDSAFDVVIAESKAKLDAEKPSEPKRKRGRPRKEDTSQSAPQGERQKLDEPQTFQPKSNLVPHIKAPLKFASSLVAKAYEVEELELVDDEAQMLAESLNALGDAYSHLFQNMSPKTAAWIGLGTTSVTIFGSKYIIYLDRKAKLNKENKENKIEVETRPEPVDAPRKTDMLASDYMRVKPKQGLFT